MINNIKTSNISSAVLAFSILLYALRGKVGAIFITISILLVMMLIFEPQKRFPSKANIYVAAFLFIFAFALNWYRSLSPQYYLIIGYFASALLLLNTREEHFEGLWKWLKGIALFEAFGVYIQLLIPGLYYSLMSLVLSSDVVTSIRGRKLEGYYTGFTREVSYTMFLVVVGLGLFLYHSDQKNIYKKWIPILFLFGALFVSGKRATLLFFIIAVVFTEVLKSNTLIKLFNFPISFFTAVITLWTTYPIWSKISVLSRIKQFIDFFAENNLIGMTSGRTVIYENALQLWETNPWFGIGWGNFKFSVVESQWYAGFDVHNCFLQVLCECGIIALVLYSIICLVSIVNSLKCVLIYKDSLNKEKYNLSLFCCYLQIFFILYSITEPILYEYTDYVLFFICFNCSNLLLKQRSRSMQRHIIIKNQVARGQIYGKVTG